MVENVEYDEHLYGDAKIPKELSQFLRHDTYSLLIKGHTGTGKTTLALSILKELNVNKNFLYISTRVSPDQLFQYHPWIENFFATTKKTLDSNPTELEKNQNMFIDARLDEPGSLFERITNELMDVKAPVIVIDTWDAIGSLMDKESLINNAKVLQTWRERARAKLIFVTETPDDRTFDFLVDGIVELKQRHHNERLVREIVLLKLRGIKILRPSYTFSLDSGFFHSFDHYNPAHFFSLDYFFQPRHIDKKFLKNHSFIATGYLELDSLLGGGFPLGGTVSIELDRHVNAKIATAFLSRIMLNFVSDNNFLFIQPFEKTNLLAFTKSHKEFITIVPNQSTIKTSKNKIGEKIEQLQRQILRIKKRDKKMVLCVLNADLLGLTAKADPHKSELEQLSKVRSNSDLTIFISRKLSNDRHTPISELADIRLSVLEIDGTMFLQLESPWSHLYAITVQPEKEHGIQIEPLV